MLPRTYFGCTGLFVFVLIQSVQTELRSDVGPSPANPDNSISFSHTRQVNTATLLTISPEDRTTATVLSTTENKNSTSVSKTAMTSVPVLTTTSSENTTDISHTTVLVSASTNNSMATSHAANNFMSTATELFSTTDNKTAQSATTIAVMNTSMSPSQTINRRSSTEQTFNTTVTTQSNLKTTGPTDQTFNTTVLIGTTLNITVPTQSIRTDETTMINNSSITPNPLVNSSTNSPNDIPSSTHHQQPMPLQSNTEVPGWGIALLVLAALMLLILLIFLIFLIYFCCCQSGGRGFMTVSDPSPYMPFNPDIPMYSTHTTIDLPNGKTYETDDSAKNRSRMYVVNPSAK